MGRLSPNNLLKLIQQPSVKCGQQISLLPLTQRMQDAWYWLRIGTLALQRMRIQNVQTNHWMARMMEVVASVFYWRSPDSFRQIPISIGVDIVLFDAEDQGSSDGGIETWCLGSQYWAQNLHVKGYSAEFGILLDMVGAKGAIFQKEDLTGVFPPSKTSRIHSHYEKVWSLAKGMNKSAHFAGQPEQADHG